MKNDSLQDIWNELKNRDEFTLVGHIIPDGDCIGSLLGLYLTLKNLGKQVNILLQHNVPPIYKYLKDADKIKPPEETPVFANVVFLDCADPDRIGDIVKEKTKNAGFKINIDHHATNNYFGDLNYVDPQAAATSEIIVQILQVEPGIKTNDIANALFAALVMDTGNFQYSSTSSRTFHIAGYLLENGADINLTRINLFESKEQRELYLLRQALNHLQFSPDGKIAWMSLTYAETKAINALELHPEGIINFTRTVKGVEVGILFREVEPGVIKIGFRSKHSVDVSVLAAHFGGGGHKQAAGAKQIGNLDEVSADVLNYVKGVLG